MAVCSTAGCVPNKRRTETGRRPNCRTLDHSMSGNVPKLENNEFLAVQSVQRRVAAPSWRVLIFPSSMPTSNGSSPRPASPPAANRRNSIAPLLFDTARRAAAILDPAASESVVPRWSAATPGRVPSTVRLAILANSNHVSTRFPQPSGIPPDSGKTVSLTGASSVI